MEKRSAVDLAVLLVGEGMCVLERNLGFPPRAMEMTDTLEAEICYE